MGNRMAESAAEENLLSATRAAFSNFYKAERERSEGCINDILTILCDGGTDTQQVEKITDRVTRHYQRL